MKPTLDKMASANIPVVTIDTEPDNGKVYMVVRADNKAYGNKACKYIGDTLKGTGEVVMTAIGTFHSTTHVSPLLNRASKSRSESPCGCSSGG